MKRYWLFGGIQYYPSGGFEDFKKSYDTLDRALNEARHLEFNYIDYPNQSDYLAWFQVFDSETREIVASEGNFFGNSSLEERQFNVIKECKAIPSSNPDTR